MRGLRIGLGLVGALSWGLACSGLAGGDPPVNRDACRSYARALEALGCAEPVLGAADCPEELDDAPCDYPAYYACMTAGLACADGRLDVTAQLACRLGCD
jgi:hypothetical protein